MTKDQLPTEVVGVTAWSYFLRSGSALPRVQPSGEADIAVFAATAADGTYALTCNGWFFRVDPTLPEFEITKIGSAVPSVWLANVPVDVREGARRRWHARWLEGQCPLEWIEQKHDGEWTRVGNGPLAIRRLTTKYVGTNGAVRRYSDIYAHSTVFSVLNGVPTRIPLLDAVMSVAGFDAEMTALKYLQALHGEELCRSDEPNLWQQVLPSLPDIPD